MQDLTIDVEDYKLNVRAAAVIIHNNKVLMHKNIHEDYYVPIGGRVKIGEDSAQTIKREIKEELGKDVEVIGYAATVENFFTETNGQKYHEYLLVSRVEFSNDDDKKIDYTLKNVEGEDYLHYEWIDLNELDNYKIFPVTFPKILRATSYPIHVINREDK